MADEFKVYDEVFLYGSLRLLKYPEEKIEHRLVISLEDNYRGIIVGIHDTKHHGRTCLVLCDQGVVETSEGLLRKVAR